MRLAFRLAALGILVVVLGLWFFGGCQLGWTKTSVPVTHIDPVTEIEGTSWERRFLPGIDFLGAGLAVAGVVFGCGYFFRPKATK